MTNIYKLMKFSQKSSQCFRLSYNLKLCRFSLKRNFSLINEPYNKCVYSLRKFNMNQNVLCYRKSMYCTSNNEDILPLDYEADEVDLINFKTMENINKNYLYPSTSDQLLSEIMNCNSIQNLFDVINENIDLLDHRHACQIILEFWNIQKYFIEEYIAHIEQRDLDKSPDQMINDFVDKITSQKEFQFLTECIEKHCDELSLKELTFCMFYFRKMKFSYSDKLVKKLIRNVEDKITNAKHEWTIMDLLKYTHSLKSDDVLRFVYHIKPTIPLIKEFLDNCSTQEDFKDITVCLLNTNYLISREILKAYKEKCQQLVDSAIITSDHVGTIIRAISFYNLLHWSKYNTVEISNLCKLVQPSIKNMDANDLIFLHKVYQIHSTPATLVEGIGKRVIVLLEEMKYDDRIKTYLKLPDLLFCQVSTTPLNNRKVLEDITIDLLKPQFSSIIFSLYKTLRYLKTSNTKICDVFWTTIIDYVLKEPNNETKLLQLCYKYMFFNNNMAGTYRNLKFEKKMIDQLLLLKNKSASYIPWKYCRITAFIISYGLNKVDISIINEHIDKIISIFHQIRTQDTFLMSKGIQMYSTFNKPYLNPDFSQAVSKLSSILDQHSKDLLLDPKLSLDELNNIFRINIINQNCYYKSLDLSSIVRNYENSHEKLTPRLVRDGCYNQFVTGIGSHNFAERVVEYIVSLKYDVSGDIINKVLIFCYMYTINIKNDLFLSQSTKIIERDFDLLYGLSLLDSCIALCYFNSISEVLTKKIFSLEFMERIDKEIADCYYKKIYPSRLRKRLMLLNRAVCIDMPQYQVPWFHKKYVEESILLEPSISVNFFYKDVLATLNSIIDKGQVLQYPAYTPYGYRVDFLLNLDKNNKPIPMSFLNEIPAAQKIAILLLNKNCFVKYYKNITLSDKSETFSIQQTKKGSSQMRKRHLEQLGYRVIEIPYMLWNSMHMAEPNAKYNYLKNKIWTDYEEVIGVRRV